MPWKWQSKKSTRPIGPPKKNKTKKTSWRAESATSTTSVVVDVFPRANVRTFVSSSLPRFRLERSPLDLAKRAFWERDHYTAWGILVSREYLATLSAGITDDVFWDGDTRGGIFSGCCRWGGHSRTGARTQRGYWCKGIFQFVQRKPEPELNHATLSRVSRCASAALAARGRSRSCSRRPDVERARRSAESCSRNDDAASRCDHLLVDKKKEAAHHCFVDVAEPA